MDERYQQLANRLDELPNGFPPTEDGVELRLLAKLFSPEEAALASELRLTLETSKEIAGRIGGEEAELRGMLKDMAKRGLIKAGRTKGGLGFAIMPFVVGFYENQLASIDREFAQLFEMYYQKVFKQVFTLRPAVHRVIPIGAAIQMDMQVHPYESAADIISQAKAWGVLDCICRKQKALIGEPCEHPLDTCMVMSEIPNAFNGNPLIQSQTKDEAMETLRRAAEAGLVHTVSNRQEGISYICNCCTCSCGVLRGLAEMGVANVVARSAFVCQVDEALCVGCELCLDACQFGALSLGEVIQIQKERCVGCGLCALSCPEGALVLVSRPNEDITSPPLSEKEWMRERAASRGIPAEKLL
jgi:electron transport complex protein RnfB